MIDHIDSARTFKEIEADVRRATSEENIASLLTCAEEFDSLGTKLGLASSHKARAFASVFGEDHAASLEQFSAAAELYSELDDKARGSNVFHNIGVVCYLLGDYPESIEAYKNSLMLSEGLDDLGSVATLAERIGSISMKVGDYPAALEYYHRAMDVHTQLGNSGQIASITGTLGIVHGDTGDFAAAQEHYQRSLDMHTELGNRSGVALATGNIGSVFKRTGDYPAALQQFQRALDLYVEMDDDLGIARFTGDIGNVYQKIGDYTTSLEFLVRAQELHEALDDKDGTARVMRSIGIVYMETGDHSAALVQFRRALIMFKGLNQRNYATAITSKILGALIASGSYAEAYSLLDEMDKEPIQPPGILVTREISRAMIQEHGGDNDGAVETLSSALELATRHRYRKLQVEIHKQLRDLSKKTNDFAGYIEHNDAYIKITEEITGKEATQKMAVQQKQREMEARDREHQKHLAVLHSTLPKHVADRVARGETVNDHFDNAAVMFLDIVGFTTISSKLPAEDVVELLDKVFSVCDVACAKYDVTRIKTIGDSLLAVSFASDKAPSSEQRVANSALDIIEALKTLDFPKSVGKIEVRIGLHSGPVVAGVLGKERLQYDVWGDTVNIASRMESTGASSRIQMSETFSLALRNDKDELATFTERGEMAIKGAGTMKTFWLGPLTQ